jgi:hypothetical protein
MKELATFHSDHAVIHISKNYERNTDKLKHYPYDLIVSSKFAHAPMNKHELRKLADFINRVLDDNSAKNHQS